MVSLFQALMIILNVIWFIMIAHIIMSWLLNFQVLNIRQPMVAQIWYGLTRLLEPVHDDQRKHAAGMQAVRRRIEAAIKRDLFLAEQ